jgi:nicotinate-nucleotide pyrophosphorylase (carboxylating)
MNNLIEQAFKEDIPDTDLTTSGLGRTEHFGLCHLIAKQDLVLSGTQLFTDCCNYRDPNAQVHWYYQNGDSVLKGQEVAQIQGNLIQIIQAERVALNFIGYLSGIATQTRQFVEACQNTSTRILDTRKTLPLYRNMVKEAVRHGGGHNHRMNLSDAILVKENHLSIAGSLELAVQSLRQRYPNQAIEVEVKNLDEVQRAVNLEVERVMLDNMTTEQIKQALKVIPPGIETEASGNMTLERIPEVAATGVHFISVGALTHSVINADFSLLVEWS